MWFPSKKKLEYKIVFCLKWKYNSIERKTFIRNVISIAKNTLIRNVISIEKPMKTKMEFHSPENFIKNQKDD